MSDTPREESRLNEQPKPSFEALIRSMIEKTEKENKENTERIPIIINYMRTRYSSLVAPGVLALTEGFLLEATSRVTDDLSIMKIMADLAHILESMRLSVEQHDEVYKSIQAIIEERSKRQEEIAKQQEELRKRLPNYLA
jgi:hypothetical protein